MNRSPTVPNPVPGNFRRAFLLTPVPAGAEAGDFPAVTFADFGEARAMVRLVQPLRAAQAATPPWSNKLVGEFEDVL